MKPVTQKREGENGTCWTACIASILELDHDDVPYFIDSKDFYGQTANWLRDKGYALIQIDVTGNNPFPYFWNNSPIWTIISGTSPRNKDWLHAVVGKNTTPYWDPHPDRTMIAGDPKYLYLIVPCGEINGTTDKAEEEKEEVKVVKKRGRPKKISG